MREAGDLVGGRGKGGYFGRLAMLSVGVCMCLFGFLFFEERNWEGSWQQVR